MQTQDRANDQQAFVATVANIGSVSSNTNPVATLEAPEQEEVHETNEVTIEESVVTTASVRDMFDKLSPDNLPSMHSFLALDKANDDNEDKKPPATEKMSILQPFQTDDNDEELTHVSRHISRQVSSGCNKMLQSAHPSTIEPSVVEEVSLLQPGITSPDHSNEIVSHFDQKIAHLSESPKLPEFSFTSVDAGQCRKNSFQPMTMQDTSEEMSAEGIDLLLMTH